jgi:hypothetical protein
MNINKTLKTLGVAIAAVLIGERHSLADRTYDGGGANNLWSTAANWDGDASLTSGDVLIFGTSGDLTINNDLAPNFAIGGITFNTGVPSTTLTGNVIDFTGGILNNSVNLQTINLNLNLVGDISPAGGNITIGGAISGSGALNRFGGGVLNLNSANSYSGGTFLGGDIQLGANDALGTGGFEFAGAILNANNSSDSTIGALTLSGDSTLNLVADSTPGSLSFVSAASIGGTETLTIAGWSGVAGSAGTDDRLFITADPGAAFLSQMQFVGFDPGAIWLGTGEIVPVPEPTDWALIIFATLAGFYKFVLPRFRKTVVA